MAQSIALWYAAGGAYHNYYTWYGGNHIKNYAASSITNQYQDGVNLHFDGLLHEPKHTHLVRLHNIISQNNKILLTQNIKRPEIIVNNNTLYYALFTEICNSSQLKQQWIFNNKTNILYNNHIGKNLCITSQGKNGPNPIQILDCTDTCYISRTFIGF